MKTIQVLKLTNNGASFVVVKHLEERVNRYWLYERSHKLNKYGYLTERKKCLVKYADLASCLAHILDLGYDPTYGNFLRG